MTADVNGTWIAEKAGDLNGVYYTYTVTLDGKTDEVCDPYARTTGVNGNRAITAELPQGSWNVCISGCEAGNAPLAQAEGTVSVAPISTTVLIRTK